MVGESKFPSARLSFFLESKNLPSDLKSAFDERSIFPKYILDYETKQRQAFELSHAQQAATLNTSLTAMPSNPNSQMNIRQTVDTLLKIKRQGSSSTLFSEHKGQWRTIWTGDVRFGGSCFVENRCWNTANAPRSSDDEGKSRIYFSPLHWNKSLFYSIICICLEASLLFSIFRRKTFWGWAFFFLQNETRRENKGKAFLCIITKSSSEGIKDQEERRFASAMYNVIILWMNYSKWKPIEGEREREWGEKAS